jgi:hypothetical protein
MTETKGRSIGKFPSWLRKEYYLPHAICDQTSRGPVSQQVWYDKDPSLLKGPKH